MGGKTSKHDNPQLHPRSFPKITRKKQSKTLRIKALDKRY